MHLPVNVSVCHRLFLKSETDPQLYPYPMTLPASFPCSSVTSTATLSSPAPHPAPTHLFDPSYAGGNVSRWPEPLGHSFVQQSTVLSCPLLGVFLRFSFSTFGTLSKKLWGCIKTIFCLSLTTMLSVRYLNFLDPSLTISVSKFSPWETVVVPEARLNLCNFFFCNLLLISNTVLIFSP